MIESQAEKICKLVYLTLNEQPPVSVDCLFYYTNTNNFAKMEESANNGWMNENINQKQRCA